MASNWRPSDRFLHAVRYVESSHGRFTYGDAGQSLGDFQVSRAAWQDVSQWRKSNGLPVYAYRRHVYNRTINRDYAANYFSLLHSELSRKLKRAPTAGELYAAYNMGLSSFAECRFRLDRVNPVTARKCREIRRMLGGQPH